ncbi:hypothetical protein QN362_10440 [Actimicrobium sp. CCC2.4]|uniref:hypothetical protein n=1 Tax=Actimicrobium sp. CCC2.4 TaxID=3048606 RepID=UPI002AC8B9F4|nr:hypothetical protein [Actimicrobium sp. CCC2.4]MEB0135745.1 hypothetical protein [Actimicrobium sp. CCC2.4]WPX33229.1 hypothetical protein RHM62_05145 [Actimicrobium sp. CCC2.4]
MKFSVLRWTVLCLFAGTASAQTLDAVDAKNASLIALDQRAYVSGTYGNGKIDGENVRGKATLGWAFEVRFGKEVTLPGLDTGKLFSANEKFRVDVVHYNEGHPDNNHRDGFALQGMYNKPLGKIVSAEVGLGPYYSMNTTTIGGVQHNNSNLGVLLSTALLIDVDQLGSGAHIRLGFNHVSMPGAGAHSSNAVLIGVGKYFDTTPARSMPGLVDDRLWLGVAAINGQTNHGNTERSAGASAEIKKYYGPWAFSASAIAEGDDDTRVDRRGLAAQAWYVQPLADNWSASAGVGPYVTTNKRGSSDQARLMALITMQVDRNIGKDWKAFASFSRVNTFREKNDRDLFRVGVMRSFGG